MQTWVEHPLLWEGHSFDESGVMVVVLRCDVDLRLVVEVHVLAALLAGGHALLGSIWKRVLVFSVDVFIIIQTWRALLNIFIDPRVGVAELQETTSAHDLAVFLVHEGRL